MPALSNRNLAQTLEMLRSGGIDANARLVRGRIEASIPDASGQVLRALFEAQDTSRAADWLAACVVNFHPRSDLAKLWLLLAHAARSAHQPSSGP